MTVDHAPERPRIGDWAGLDDGALLELYRRMVLLRAFDERCVIYHRQGRIGPAPRIYNHEAIQVGALHALAERDWIFPSYRETALATFRGMPLSTPLAQWSGHPAGWWDPRDYRVASVAIPVGTQVPHAAGFAWGTKARGEDTCTLVFFGDGATSEGSFHEGANFAAVMEAPLVLLCSNNGWAISTPIRRQTRAARLVDKAAGYGMRGVRVDGRDPVAVYAAVRDAVEHGRAGNGPTFIEAMTDRVTPHGTADDHSLYRDLTEVAGQQADECLVRYELRLTEAGLLTAGLRDEIAAESVAAARQAMTDVEALPPPDPGLIFSTTYADLPAGLARQWREMDDDSAR
jgi:pyruvate dehydrogenase E1 component alpha subunit